MKTTLLMFAAAFALAACDRTPDERASQTPPRPSAAAGGTGTAAANTPTTPANIGQPQTEAEKKDGANPTQQQVDPKQGEQHRDFQMKGDAAGPRGPDTEPKSGG